MDILVFVAAFSCCETLLWISFFLIPGPVVHQINPLTPFLAIPDEILELPFGDIGHLA